MAAVETLFQKRAMYFRGYFGESRHGKSTDASGLRYLEARSRLERKCAACPTRVGQRVLVRHLDDGMAVVPPIDDPGPRGVDGDRAGARQPRGPGRRRLPPGAPKSYTSILRATFPAIAETTFAEVRVAGVMISFRPSIDARW